MADSAAATNLEEPILEPDLPIIDSHHHLWKRPRHVTAHQESADYLLPDLLRDIAGGHNVRATVYMEAPSQHRPDGPEAFRPVGETEFAAAVAAECNAQGANVARVCAGIVSYADLALGDAVEDVLHAHVAAGRGHFRGVRCLAVWDEDTSLVRSRPQPPKGLLAHPGFRAGLARLTALGLSFETWVYHTQLAELVDLARSFPDTTIILNHLGTPLYRGAYGRRRGQVFHDWHHGIAQVAACPNVWVKLGGLGMWALDWPFYLRQPSPGSAELAAAWRPYVKRCIDLFGPDRCMFESNFPVDKSSCSYRALWNAFKRLTADLSRTERTALFGGTAARAYRLNVS